jgi:hypothetical protein
MNGLTLKSALAALVIAAARCGLVVGYTMLVGWPRGMWVVPYSHQLLVCIAAATFLVAFGIWRLLVAGRPSGTTRGALAGFATGIASHPVTWVMFSLIDESIPSDMNLFQRVGWGLIYSIPSLLIFGLFTVLATTLAGTVVGCAMSGTRTHSQEGSDLGEKRPP